MAHMFAQGARRDAEALGRLVDVEQARLHRPTLP